MPLLTPQPFAVRFVGRPFIWRCVVVGLLILGYLSGAQADGRDAVAVPMRMVNLHPFHVLYGVPGSFGARVLRLGSFEWIASLDAASHFSRFSAGIPRAPVHDATFRDEFRAGMPPGAERILVDGETYRQALTLRVGLRERWEAFIEVPLLAHRGGAFDEFIADWHDVFGLDTGGRQFVPHGRMAIFYAGDTGRGGVHVDLERDVGALGDASFGLGYAVRRMLLPNDGVAVRAAVKLPTGDPDLLTGSGGLSASLWAETSGTLPGAAASRAWLYAATVGVLGAEAPRGLPDPGSRWLVFGRFGVTWRPLRWLALTSQIDVHTSPYTASRLPPLADVGVMLGFGGILRIGKRATLEVAVTEDDSGLHRSAPDIGLHVALRWHSRPAGAS